MLTPKDFILEAYLTYARIIFLFVQLKVKFNISELKRNSQSYLLDFEL